MDQKRALAALGALAQLSRLDLSRLLTCEAIGAVIVSCSTRALIVAIFCLVEPALRQGQGAGVFAEFGFQGPVASARSAGTPGRSTG
jgi:hypothetical protein